MGTSSARAIWSYERSAQASRSKASRSRLGKAFSAAARSAATGSVRVPPGRAVLRAYASSRRFSVRQTLPHRFAAIPSSPGRPRRRAVSDTVTEVSREGGGARERSAQLHEERFQREPRGELELFEVPPGLADELRRALSALQPLERRVLQQHGRPVGVNERARSARRRSDEISIPRRKLLQRRQQLLPLGPATGPPHTLLRFAR